MAFDSTEISHFMCVIKSQIAQITAYLIAMFLNSADQSTCKFDHFSRANLCRGITAAPIIMQSRDYERVTWFKLFDLILWQSYFFPLVVNVSKYNWQSRSVLCKMHHYLQGDYSDAEDSYANFINIQIIFDVTREYSIMWLCIINIFNIKY